MEPRLEPHIVLPGSAAQAVEFYRSVFGGSVTTLRVADVEASGTTIIGEADSVVRARLDAPGFSLSCGDVPTGMAYEPGRSVTLALRGPDQREAQRLFASLADGGQVTVPLSARPWGEESGQLIDRFGVVWMLTIGS